jgi:hypothetical protein
VKLLVTNALRIGSNKLLSTLSGSNDDGTTTGSIETGVGVDAQPRRNQMMEGLIASFVLACTFGLGWAAAHSTVAYECKQLGGFYVGETVYECKVKGETK